MRENTYQAKLIKTIKDRFPDAIVMKNDCNYIQGIPDLTILHGDRWATLEVKKDGKASHRPNQDFYVDKMNRMSYSSFISPETESEVLDEMERSFSSNRRARVSRSKQT